MRKKISKTKSPTTKGKEIGLVLQGGGALGAYESGALIRILEEGFRPSIISGTSIGAVNAAVIAAPNGGDPIQCLKNLWIHLTNDAPFFIPKDQQKAYGAMGHPRFYKMRQDLFNYSNWTSIYDCQPAIDTMYEFIDFDYLNSKHASRVVFTATNVNSGKMERFSNKTHKITPQHIMASGSLPPGFPAVEIDGNHYWDGGLYDNTPAQSLIRILDEHQIETMPIIVIEAFSGHGGVPKDINEALDRMTEIVYEDKFWKMFEGHSKGVEYSEMLWQLDADLPQSSAVRKTDAFKRLMHFRVLKHVFTVHAPHAALSGINDFSSETVQDRQKVGYESAAAFFDNCLYRINDVYTHNDHKKTSVSKKKKATKRKK